MTDKESRSKAEGKEGEWKKQNKWNSSEVKQKKESWPAEESHSS